MPLFEKQNNIIMPVGPEKSERGTQIKHWNKK